MRTVRIGDERVLAVDIHDPNLISTHVQRGDLGDPELEIDFGPPRFLEFFLIGRVGDRLEPRVVVGQRAHVPGPLNVVLPPHRVYPRSFPADVPRQQREVTQTLHILDAANVLRDPEGVVDRPSLGPPVHQGRLLDVLGRHLADLGGPLGRKALYVFQEVLVLSGAGGHEGLVH